MSDGAQSLYSAQFRQMMKELKPYVELWKAERLAESVAAV